MLTDRWSEPQIKVYARLLHVKPEDVLRKDVLFSSGARRDYFRDVGERDLFLDSDTGIAEKPEKEHVGFSDIAGLLAEATSRMLLIYQHASRNKNGLKEKLNLLSKRFQGCGMFAYDCGSVSMVVISRDRDRVQQTLARLKCWLGPTISKRIVIPLGVGS